MSLEELVSMLKLIEKLYDAIRVVDPLKKKVVISQDGSIHEAESQCFSFWQTGEFCENCLSMRAYLEDNTFIKFDYNGEKVYLVTATPIQLESDGKVVLEFLKDVTNSGIIPERDLVNSCSIRDLVSKMNEEVVKDYLTGLYNKRFIYERLPVDILYSILEEKPISIIMADIDFFKNVNDEYGHITGDFVLKEFARVLTTNIRKGGDWVARYGGEEFLIVLRNTDVHEATQIAERMRKNIEAREIKYEDVSIKITASFGVCTRVLKEADVDQLIKQTDDNLYSAKKSGKNRVVSSEI